MDRIQLLDDIEKYLRNEMTPGEKYAFEELRQNDPDVDLMVVEHSLFMHQLEQFGDQKNFRSTLHDIHTDLAASGVIKETAPKAIVKQLWKKHKRVMAVAASSLCASSSVIFPCSVILFKMKTRRSENSF